MGKYPWTNDEGKESWQVANDWIKLHCEIIIVIQTYLADKNKTSFQTPKTVIFNAGWYLTDVCVSWNDRTD